MYVLLLTTEDGDRPVRAYGPYTFKDEAEEAVKALDILFPIGDTYGLWTDIISLETFSGYNYTGKEKA